jgi:hypothetical protein
MIFFQITSFQTNNYWLNNNKNVETNLTNESIFSKKNFLINLYYLEKSVIRQVIFCRFFIVSIELSPLHTKDFNFLGWL